MGDKTDEKIWYPTPLEAMKGKHENLAYVTCISANWKLTNKPDILATIDLNPKSSTYSQIIHQLEVPNVGDELHHTGWNACSSCTDCTVKRNYFIMPGLNSDRIYIVDVSRALTPKLHKIIEPYELHKNDVSAPHTVHCLPNGDVMISCLGDADGNAKGSFILLEQGTFRLKGTWEQTSISYNYDFWYQPRHNVMISTEWAAPKIFRQGFSLQDFKQGFYGSGVTFWDWRNKIPIQHVDLSPDGQIPLEVRFLHDPNAKEAFVGCALSSTVFRLFENMEGVWNAEKVISVENKKIKHWFMPEMPGLITDIIISLDDRFLYLSNYIQGDVQQYDITDRKKPQLVGQIFLGGSMCKDSKVVAEDGYGAPIRESVKGIPIRGGPQMLQLSLDGKRLYVTNSLHSAWDTQFYPEIIKNGSMMVLLNVNTEKGGLTLDPNFLVDFGCLERGSVLAHEIRFRDGDCTSDIWV